MDILVVDMETFYDKKYSLSSITTEEYIRDPQFETIGVAVKRNDEPAKWFTGTKAQTKRWLDQWDWGNSVAVAHNAMFDMAILNWEFDIRPKRIADTLSMLRAIDGPHAGNSLAKAVERYGLGEKGTEVINALGKRRIDFTTAEMARYGDYCINDADLTYALFVKLMNGFPASELRLIDLTLRMFTEPVLMLDGASLKTHLSDVQTRKARLLDKALVDKTQIMSNPKLAELLTMLGVVPPTKVSPKTGKEAFAFAKTDEAFKVLLEHENPIVQAVVAARLGVKSTIEESRTERFIDIANRGPLPVPLRYYGAHTGRWSGEDKINLQNLPRSSVLKEAILAPEGYVFIDCDSSQIEARTLAWLAGQDDLVEFFDKNNAEVAAGVEKKDMQFDPYKIMASEIYGKPVSEINEHPERFIGKMTILGAGYGMGATKFQAQLKTMGVSLSSEECASIVYKYRDQFKHIPALWAEGDKALDALMSARTAPLGKHGALLVDMFGIKLPNGMYLRYDNLRKERDPKSGRDQFVYDVKKGRATLPTYIYGGKCLAADTEVLTERGWVPIIGVHPHERIWDGVEWVNHGGLTYQGKKSTTILSGVRMTPDHEVLTEKGWRSASSCEGLHRADFRMPDGSEIRGGQWSPFGMDIPLHMREGRSAHRGGSGEVRTARWHPLMRVRGWAKEQIARHVKAPRILGVAVHEGPLPTAYTPSMAQLRGTWDKCVRRVGEIVRGILGGYGADVQAGPITGQEGQQRGLHTGELPLGDTAGAGAEYALRAPCGPKEGSRADGDTTLYTSVSVAPEPVYDLLNAGPRSRFVVRGASGPFIVHNCVENVCQALARIIIGEQMLMIARKYRVVMTVHDSVGVIAPIEEADKARAFVEACMRLRPKWATALPLNCESKKGASYGG